MFVETFFGLIYKPRGRLTFKFVDAMHPSTVVTLKKDKKCFSQ
jgi:hypothetical protein